MVDFSPSSGQRGCSFSRHSLFMDSECVVLLALLLVLRLTVALCGRRSNYFEFVSSSHSNTFDFHLSLSNPSHRLLDSSNSTAAARPSNSGSRN